MPLFIRLLKRILYQSDFLLSSKKIILESSPDYSDSTKYVYDELIRRHINKGVKIYWLLSGEKKRYDRQKNVFFLKRSSLRARIIRCTAKFIIDSNNYIHKLRRGQFRVYLTHGMAFKLPSEYAKDAGEIDRMIVSSDYFIKPHATLYNTPSKNVVATGMPRNDGFFNSKHIDNRVPGQKYIIWMPTYRNHRNANSIHTGIHFEYGVPCINSEKEIVKLNGYLIRNNVTLVIRFHPAEDTSAIKHLHLSNIILYENSIFAKSDLQLYDLLKDTDALITDYSSVYYDYLFTLKPVALAIPDLKEYLSTYDLITDNFEKDIKGYHIYSYNDLLKFINDVAEGVNTQLPNIRQALRRYQKYNDGKASKRVVDMILGEMRGDKR